VKAFLRENPQTMAEIDGRVREHLAVSLAPDVVGVSGDDDSVIDIDTPISLD
jgi:hypothetical protein